MKNYILSIGMILTSISVQSRTFDLEDALTISRFHALEARHSIEKDGNAPLNQKKLLRAVSNISKITTKRAIKFSPQETTILREILQNARPKTLEETQYLKTLDQALHTDKAQESKLISKDATSAKIEEIPSVPASPSQPTQTEWLAIRTELDTRIRRQIGIDLGLADEARSDFMEQTVPLLEKVIFPQQFEYLDTEIKSYARQIKKILDWIKVAKIPNPIDLPGTPKIGINSLLNHIINAIFIEHPELNSEFIIQYIRDIRSQFSDIAQPHLIWTYQDTAILKQSTYDYLKKIITDTIQKYKKNTSPSPEKCMELLTNLGIENVTIDNSIDIYHSLTRKKAREIRKKRALELHPDKNGGNNAGFNTMNAAYEEIKTLKTWL